MSSAGNKHDAKYGKAMCLCKGCFLFVRRLYLTCALGMLIFSSPFPTLLYLIIHYKFINYL